MFSTLKEIPLKKLTLCVQALNYVFHKTPVAECVQVCSLMGNNQTEAGADHNSKLFTINYLLLLTVSFPGRLIPHAFIVNNAQFQHGTKTEFQPLLSSLSIHSELGLVIMEGRLESQISVSQRRGAHLGPSASSSAGDKHFLQVEH